MKRKCEHCQSEYECKRLTKKYCSDNCKQLAYFKRNGFQQSERPIAIESKENNGVTNTEGKKSIQAQIMDEIATKVLELIKLREGEQENNLQNFCKPEPFKIKRTK